ncbi:MAG TPA: molybdopterin converting factor subunit 1 [Thermoanaerobaculia bacterium]|nr:molybdopterin converting factor subunit 1 [Thermoanaerobaculia bacterium]
MKVRILFFASLRDELGDSRSVEAVEALPGETTVAALREAVAALSPAAARLGRRLLVAVNERYATDGDPVRPGDSVAFLPPLAGG